LVTPLILLPRTIGEALADEIAFERFDFFPVEQAAIFGQAEAIIF
jgi:hypothetical protein